jgi:glycosyltransferase involved in cell wall biosynthesis
VWQKILALGRRAFSGFVSKRLFEKLVRDFQPQIIHVHNICHYLSPAFLSVARKYHIPVVMHLHDYSLLSPNYLLFNEKGDYQGGKEECYFECVKDRCFKNSYVESFLVALEMYCEQRIQKIFTKNVTMFVAPSRCMQEQVKLWRPDIRNVEVIPHGVVIRPLAEENVSLEHEQYFLYVGRLSSEKGVETLLSAFSQLASKEVKLRIVGNGPLRETLKKRASELHIENRVQFLGFQKSEDVRVLMEKSLAVIVPSEWKEVFGLVVIEAMERGKLVIGARSGAIPEIIEDKKTGILFAKGDTADLSRALAWTLENPVRAQEMGSAGRIRVEEQYSSVQHRGAIEQLYQDLLKV